MVKIIRVKSANMDKFLAQRFTQSLRIFEMDDTITIEDRNAELPIQGVLVAYKGEKTPESQKIMLINDMESERRIEIYDPKTFVAIAYVTY